MWGLGICSSRWDPIIFPPILVDKNYDYLIVDKDQLIIKMHDKNKIMPQYNIH